MRGPRGNRGAIVVRVGRPEELFHVLWTGRRRTGPQPTRFWGLWSIGLGVLTFVSGGFLIAMFASLGLGRGAAPWGPINDLLSAIGNLMLAALIPVLSRRAVRRPWEGLGVRLLSGVSVVSAISGFLLVAQRLGFEASTAVSMVAIVLQVLWMGWLSSRFAEDPAVPRLVVTLGLAFAAAMLAGLGLVGAGLALGWDSPIGLVFVVPGAALGGVAWLAWPAWYVLLGRSMLRPGDPPRPGQH